MSSLRQAHEGAQRGQGDAIDAVGSALQGIDRVTERAAAAKAAAAEAAAAEAAAAEAAATDAQLKADAHAHAHAEAKEGLRWAHQLGTALVTGAGSSGTLYLTKLLHKAGLSFCRT